MMWTISNSDMQRGETVARVLKVAGRFLRSWRACAQNTALSNNGMVNRHYNLSFYSGTTNLSDYLSVLSIFQHKNTDREKNENFFLSFAYNAYNLWKNI